MLKTLLALLFVNSLAQAQGARLAIYAPIDFAPEVFESANDTLARSDLPGYASVREQITLDLARGVNSVRFDQMPRKLDASSVTLSPLNPPKTLKILSQQFENDVVNPSRLLDLYIGRRIQLDTAGIASERLVGTLLGVSDGVTLQTDSGQVRTIREYAGITFADIPGGLVTRPSLIWQIDSPEVTFQAAELTYLTAGMSWWADYTITLKAGTECNARLGAWANIANASGRSFTNATIELVQARNNLTMARVDASPARTYSLERSTDLPTGSVKQLPLLPPQREYPCERVFALECSPTWKASAPITDAPTGDSTSAGAQLQLRVMRLNADGPNVMLPGGRIRVQQEGSVGTLNLIAWERVKQSSRANMLSVDLGLNDDIQIRRRVNDFAHDEAGAALEEAIALEVTNSSDARAEVRVRENLYRWRTWSITESSLPFERVSASAIEFKVSLKPNERQEIRFVVRYRWTPSS